MLLIRLWFCGNEHHSAIFLAKAVLIQHGFDLSVGRMAGDDLISGIQDLLVCRFCTNTEPKNANQRLDIQNIGCRRRRWRAGPGEGEGDGKG